MVSSETPSGHWDAILTTIPSTGAAPPPLDREKPMGSSSLQHAASLSSASARSKAGGALGAAHIHENRTILEGCWSR